MKKTTWKNKKKFNPQIILDKAYKSFNKETVGFDVFDYENALAVLQTMISYGPELEAGTKKNLLRSTINECVKKKQCDKDDFLETINNKINEYFAKPFSDYRLLSSISIEHSNPFNTISINNHKVKIPKSYPKKYANRESGIQGMESFVAPDNYRKVIIYANARTPNEAMLSSQDNLDLFRGLLCLRFNHSMSMSYGGSIKPINRIMLGGLHTLHNANGSRAVEYWWYQPNYIKIKPIHFKDDPKLILRAIKFDIKRLKLSPFKKKIEDAIIRYVRAFDEIQMNSVIIQGWGALELLAGYNSNNDSIVRRCSFLFEDYQYHRQVLEHIREYRNSYVHNNEGSEESAIICYQLQHYFKRLVYFYLHFSDYFSSIDEANTFLDMPMTKDTLERKIELANKAIQYRNLSDTK